MSHTHTINKRFRGFLPVVIDIETGGFNSQTDAVLEIAATIIQMDTQGELVLGNSYSYHVEPFAGANIEAAALEFTGIDPYHPLRPAQKEQDTLEDLFAHIREAIQQAACSKAILVGHNAAFDQAFLMAATERCSCKQYPFHAFSNFDTATLAGLALGQTVLAKACKSANIEFDSSSAHSALYDTQKTAELFCYIVNRWKALGGWPISSS